MYIYSIRCGVEFFRESEELAYLSRDLQLLSVLPSELKIGSSTLVLMRSSSYLSLGAALILVLVLSSTAMEAEAIRLDAETRASVSSSGNQTTFDKPDENADKGPASASSISEAKRSVHVGENEVRAVAHKLPEFHEDYYGPTDHSPRHH